MCVKWRRKFGLKKMIRAQTIPNTVFDLSHSLSTRNFSFFFTCIQTGSSVYSDTICLRPKTIDLFRGQRGGKRSIDPIVVRRKVMLVETFINYDKNDCPLNMHFRDEPS